MDGNLCKSTIKSRKIQQDGDGMEMKVMTMKMQWCDDGDDAQTSTDPSGNDDRCPSDCFPSSSLPEVSFLRILVSLNVGSQIRLHGLRVFDQAVPRAYHWSPKHILLGSFAGFLPGARLIAIKDLMAFNQHISVQK
jgi:hypothetical protein